MEVCKKFLLSGTGRRLLSCRPLGSESSIKGSAARSVRCMSTALAEELEEITLPPPKIKDVYKASENTLCVTFSDNSKCLFSSTWLRDSCKCQACVHPPTQEKQLDSAKIDPKIQPLSWDVENNFHRLEVFWPQSARRPPHASNVNTAEWLHQFTTVFQPKEAPAETTVSAAPAQDQQRPHDEITDEVYINKKSSVILWNRDEIEENPPELEFDDFMGTRAGLKKMLKNVCKYGISILRGVPLNEHQIVNVARRMGYIRETGYGVTFDVKYNADPKTHLAYTGLQFGHHTDLAYRERAPGVQLLHCLKAADPASAQQHAGGKSFFVDGFYAAQWLRYNYPQHFETLSKTPVILSFLDSDRDRWFRESWPVISVDHMGKLKDIHYSLFSMRPPLLPQDKVANYYQALRLFSQRIEQSTLQYSFYLTPGDLVVINNRRILHGRTAFEPSKVERHLKGCYMDLDELKSLYEKMRKDDDL
uniref:Putative gamma-butyrobetaine2-oxoglutarate dioxygenase n=1 Tax=Ixodes ricinus TaxID=34613 RepID=V5I1C4_IXORI